MLKDDKPSYLPNNSLNFRSQAVDEMDNRKIINFFGLTGTHGDLPEIDTEKILLSLKERDYSHSDFYTIFLNRLGFFFFSIQSNFSLRQNTDLLLETTSRLMGLEKTLAVRFQKYLLFLYGTHRSKEKLAIILGDVLGVAVEIEEFPEIQENIPLEYLTKLKKMNTRLGRSFLIGNKIRLDHTYIQVNLHFSKKQAKAYIEKKKKIEQTIRLVVDTFCDSNYKVCIKTHSQKACCDNALGINFRL